MIERPGIVPANGVGGASGACSPAFANGNDGADGRALLAVAAVGVLAGDCGLAGGGGATALNVATQGGGAPCEANGGGGGGGVGRNRHA